MKAMAALLSTSRQGTPAKAASPAELGKRPTVGLGGTTDAILQKAQGMHATLRDIEKRIDALEKRND